MIEEERDEKISEVIGSTISFLSKVYQDARCTTICKTQLAHFVSRKIQELGFANLQYGKQKTRKLASIGSALLWKVFEMSESSECAYDLQQEMSDFINEKQYKKHLT